MRVEKGRIYNERRIRLFVSKMEKVCDPVPMRHKAYTMRRLLSKDPRDNALTRLILSQKCKQTEAFNNLRELNIFFNQSCDQRDQLILLEDSLKILFRKTSKNIQEVMLDNARARRQQVAENLVSTQVLKERNGFRKLIQNMKSLRGNENLRNEKANFLVRRLIGACTGKEIDAIDMLQRNRLAANARLSNGDKAKKNLIRQLIRSQQAKQKQALGGLIAQRNSMLNNDGTKNDLIKMIARKQKERSTIALENLRRNN